MVFPVNFNVVRMRLKPFLVDCVRMKKKFEIRIAKKMEKHNKISYHNIVFACILFFGFFIKEIICFIIL